MRQFKSFRTPKLLPCACGPKSMFPTPQLSSLVVAIDDLVFRVSEESCLDNVYERFL